MATTAAGLKDMEPPGPTTPPEPEVGVDAELQEVRGPSAFGGGQQRFFELLLLMAVTDFKKSFHGTVLGYAWSLLRPLLTFAVLLIVFTRIIRIGSQIDNYPMFLLFNIVFFGFFQEATMTATTSVVARESIVRKTQFPRLVIPLATVLTRIVQPRHEPARGRRLLRLLRDRSDLDVAVVPGAALPDGDSGLRRCDVAVGPLRPPPRRGHHLGRPVAGPLLRERGAVPDRVRAPGHPPRRDARQSADR